MCPWAALLETVGTIDYGESEPLQHPSAIRCQQKKGRKTRVLPLLTAKTHPRTDPAVPGRAPGALWYTVIFLGLLFLGGQSQQIGKIFFDVS